MTKSEGRRYWAGWKAVHEFERRELLSMTVEQKFQQLAGLMASFGIFHPSRFAQHERKETSRVMDRWQKLRRLAAHG